MEESVIQGSIPKKPTLLLRPHHTSLDDNTGELLSFPPETDIDVARLTKVT